MSELENFNIWFSTNKNAIEHLYYKLINMSKLYGIKINNTQQAKDDFISMIYNESSGQLINKQLYPEFFKKYK